MTIKISLHNQLLNEYDDMLDELYGEITILGAELPASRILRELDINLYNLGFLDWENYKEEAERDKDYS